MILFSQNYKKNIIIMILLVYSFSFFMKNREKEKKKVRKLVQKTCSGNEK